MHVFGKEVGLLPVLLCEVVGVAWKQGIFIGLDVGLVHGAGLVQAAELLAQT